MSHVSNKKQKKSRLRRRIGRMLRWFGVQRKYKDRLFRYLFRDKQDLLELYNAVNGTAYDNAKDLEITTLENVIYLSMKNDLSFAFMSTMNLYEHQSTFNPNMPIRGVSYFARIYENYISESGMDMYQSSPLRLPMPQFVVFYNGKKDEPDELELKLSDLFVAGKGQMQKKPALECTARMININIGHNKELLSACRRLNEYAYFVARVEFYLGEEWELEEAVELAVADCIRNDIMTDVLTRFRNEVCEMFLTEYDEDLHLRNTYAEGRKEGHAEGYAEGIRKAKAESILRLLEKKGTVTKEVREKILAETDEKMLDEWFEKALEAVSVEEFMQKNSKIS